MKTGGVLYAHRSLNRLFGHHEQKFFSAVSIDLIILTAALEQCPRNFCEHFITVQMAIFIIIALEIVDIAHDRAKAPAVFHDTCEKDV
jgi:hypothetical protein